LLPLTTLVLWSAEKLIQFIANQSAIVLVNIQFEAPGRLGAALSMKRHSNATDDTGTEDHVGVYPVSYAVESVQTASYTYKYYRYMSNMFVVGYLRRQPDG
jgi:hypothetical protein